MQDLNLCKGRFGIGMIDRYRVYYQRCVLLIYKKKSAVVSA